MHAYLCRGVLYNNIAPRLYGLLTFGRLRFFHVVTLRTIQRPEL